MSLNLEKQLCFYGAYHHNPINVTIHMICVPLLLSTAFLLLTNTPTLIPLPSWLTIPNLPLNLGTLSAFVYSGFYILLEPVAGSMLVPIILGSTAGANHLTSIYPSTTNKTAAAVHIVSWILQFVGHSVYEGRAPALMDNLVQATFLAPFFVWMEFLFMFGYRPELKGRVDKAVEKEIQKVKTQKLNGIVKNGKAN